MIAMTRLLRDEEDILEANLDFHFAMRVDFVIVGQTWRYAYQLAG